MRVVDLLALASGAALIIRAAPGAQPAAEFGASIPANTAPSAAALIGKPPPPVKVAQWIKGDPIKDFEKGKVYVVDFCGTWCGPCQAAIPHLTKLAQEYQGRVEVIGVSISEWQKNAEDTAYIDPVRSFVSAWIVSTGEEPRFDSRLALATAKTAYEGAKPDTRWAQFAKWRLGGAYFHVGEPGKATEWIRAALEGVRKLKATIDFGNLEDECEDALRVLSKPAK